MALQTENKLQQLHLSSICSHEVIPNPDSVVAAPALLPQRSIQVGDYTLPRWPVKSSFLASTPWLLGAGQFHCILIVDMTFNCLPSPTFTHTLP